jgi:hypothetical protein
MATVPTVPTGYTLEEAEADIATLTGLVDRLAEAIGLADGPIPNVTAASGCTLYSGGGHAKYEGFDNGEYSTGRASVIITANQTINTIADIIVGANSTPMSWPVGVGQYLLSGMINWTQGSVQTAQNNGFSGPSISGARFENTWWPSTGFGQANGLNTRETASLGQAVTPPFANATVVAWYFTGSFTTTAAGTVSVVAAAPVPADTFTIGANSFATLWPIT